MRTLLCRSPLVSRVSLSFRPIVCKDSGGRKAPVYGLRFYSDAEDEDDDGFVDHSGRGRRLSGLYKRIRYPEWENQVNAVENYQDMPIVDIERYSDRIIPHEMIVDEYNANDVTQQENPPTALEMGMIIPVRIVDMKLHSRFVTIEPTMEQYTQQYPVGILPRREISRQRYPPYEIQTEIEPGDEYKMLVLQVIENLDGTGRMTPVMSLRRVAPILPESFQPATLAVFNVPQAMVRPECLLAYCSSISIPVSSHFIPVRTVHSQLLPQLRTPPGLPSVPHLPSRPTAHSFIHPHHFRTQMRRTRCDQRFTSESRPPRH